MNTKIIIALLSLVNLHAVAQTKVTSILTADSWSGGGTTYVLNGITYQWAQNPNNVSRKVIGLSTASSNYDFDNTLNGQIKLRRKNNAQIVGDYNLVFSEGYQAGSVNSMSTPMPTDMESFLAGNFYNRGAENLFDNTGTNRNNVERLDWIVQNGFTSLENDKAGFVVIQKGNEGDYMPVNIAAVTAIDASGNPTAYGPVKRIAETEWENIFNSSFGNRINKAYAGNQLLAAGGGVHSRSGIYVKLSELGINNNVTVYGYSLFADDLPITTASNDLVSITNNNLFPLNSCCYCGFDFIAVAGLFKEANTLPLAIQSFNGSKLDNNANLIKFTTNNYHNEIEKLELVKSYDGVSYTTCATFPPSFLNSYSFVDAKLGALKTYYRIKITKLTGGVIVSNILKVENDRNVKSFELVNNPVRNQLSFAYKCTQKTKLQATIIDLFGKIISTNALTANVGTNLVTLNATSNLANGIYILQISKEGKLEQSIRFMKQ